MVVKAEAAMAAAAAKAVEPAKAPAKKAAPVKKAAPKEIKPTAKKSSGGGKGSAVAL